MNIPGKRCFPRKVMFFLFDLKILKTTETIQFWFSGIISTVTVIVLSWTRQLQLSLKAKHVCMRSKLWTSTKKCQYVLKQYSVLKKFCNKFTYNFVKACIFIFCIFGFDTLQEVMFVWPIVSELRFYGCCHPCFANRIVILSPLVITQASKNLKIKVPL